MGGCDKVKSAPGRISILILCDFASRKIGTIREHLDAFKRYSENSICFIDPKCIPLLGVRFDDFDAVVIHYSIVIAKEYLSAAVAARIRSYRGYKIVFIQDEYRWVNETGRAIFDLGIDVIYSVVNADVIDKIYYQDNIKRVRRRFTLTGFVSRDLVQLEVPSYTQRLVDVGYRARRLPMWLGQFAQEKWQIGERFRCDAAQYGLLCDIECEESKRIYGQSWINFLTSCKAVLGTESGASFIDYTGEVAPLVEAYEEANPDALFEEVQARFLEDRDGETIIRVISPRCFEAAALRTLMVLYPGGYSGVLQPWRHYVPLERDHGNMSEVVSVLRDPVYAESIVNACYSEVALNPCFGFQAMVEEFDRDLKEFVRSRSQLSESCRAAIEKRNERIFLLWFEPLRQCHEMCYRVIHWGIRTLCPKDYRGKIISRLRALSRWLRRR